MNINIRKDRNGVTMTLAGDDGQAVEIPLEFTLVTYLIALLETAQKEERFDCNMHVMPEPSEK